MTPKDLPEITTDDKEFLTYNPNTSDVIEWIQKYAAAAYELGARSTAAQPVEQTSAVTVLPDGSAFMTGSLPLPKDHWIFAPRCAEWDNVRDTSADTPHPILNNSHRAAVRAAMRYAIRGATMCGKDMDFDPDALVLNAAYALCGPAFGVTLPVDAPPAASGDSTPPSEPAGLTDDRIKRHTLRAADCPPDSKVLLVSSVRRFLAAQGDPSGALRPEPEAVGQGRWWRKRPVVVEAVQWLKDGDHPDVQPLSFVEAQALAPGNTSYPGNNGEMWDRRAMGAVGTLEGRHIVTPGDWIIRGVKGEHYPCKPDIFAATYEPAEPPQAASVERGD